MKKLMILPILILILVAIGIGGAFWAKNAFSPVSSTEAYEAFIIPKGTSAGEIAAKLASEGIIKSSLAFKVYTQFTGISKGIFAGEYKVSPHMSLPEIVKVLTSGPLEVWTTIPEGLRREEIAEKFIAGLDKRGEDAITFRSEFLTATKDLDGYLFPDTYLFPKEVTGGTVAARMNQTFDSKLKDFETQVGKSKLSLEEIVTLASILERETKTDAERPVVAGILLNRINIGMPLQADATVQYAMANVKCKTGSTGCDWWPRPILRDDLDINSKYNTYKNSGLPPGPIANAGLSSLKAAISPESSEYYYYIHEDNGKIHYAKTLDEHNQNVRTFLGKQ